MLRWVALHHVVFVVLCRILWCRVVSCRVASCRVVSCRCVVLFSFTYVIHDICPSLHGNALKHSQHREEYVVKGCDSFVGSSPVGNLSCARVVLLTRSASGVWFTTHSRNNKRFIDSCKEILTPLTDHKPIWDNTYETTQTFLTY